jgi:ribosome biogenesis GTPase
MDLYDLGFTKELDNYLKSNGLTDFTAGRITQEHRERYVVTDGSSEYDAEITGNMRFSASSRADFPAVGDWVTMTIYDKDKAIITGILPRRSLLERQTVGKAGEKQIISANIDVAFIVQAINNNFNINRLERYLTICYSADIEPVFVISKTDLASEAEISNSIEELTRRDRKVRYVLLSNLTLNGMDQITNIIEKGRTYCVIGSSGVGKSTLINNLLRKNVLRTGHISLSTNKGRHITGHRELFVLENGGIIIDTPGMKELGIADSEKGINTTYSDITEFSRNCKFPDCNHINETGCAVIEAVKLGKLDQQSYDNYLKMRREQERFQTSVAEKRRKEKIFGRIIKDYNKNREKNNL